jgi:ABC-type dipeptide/oligopeptide/nickel transport system ATPase subunit
MVFQDPFRSFNPRLTVGRALAEGPMNFGERRDRVVCGVPAKCIAQLARALPGRRVLVVVCWTG